jgi:hypothetical protein
MSREALQLVHHHPGRLRVRAHALEGASERVTKVTARLDSLPGIIKLDHNKVTGSLLVTYEPGMIEPDTIVAEIADAAELDLPRDEPRDPARPALIAIGVTRELNAAVAELAGNRADLKTLVPGALAGLAAFSWFTQGGPRLPRWDNLLYWSYTIFTNLHQREIEQTKATPATPETSEAK